MAKLSLAPLGVNGATVGNHRRTPPPPRTCIMGWTEDAARRNKRFLMTVDPVRLDGLAVPFTLTVRDCPPSAEDWGRRVKAMRERLRRMGCLRFHWVVEWQGRGHPHLHGIAFFDRDQVARVCPGMSADMLASRSLSYGPHQPEDVAQWDAHGSGRRWAKAIVAGWLEIAADLGPSPRGQHAEPLMAFGAWAQYLAKHASRGASHYQRQRSSLPAGWQSSGRLWGKGGDWPTWEMDLAVDQRTFWRFRRASRRWQRARARTMQRRGELAGNRALVNSARAILAYLARSGASSGKTPAEKRRWSEVRGLSVHMAHPWAQTLLEWAAECPTAIVRDWVPGITLEAS